MAKAKTKDSTDHLEDLRAKVLRRSEKLAKSLRLLVAQTEPGRSPAQKLLKALDEALPNLQPFVEAQRSGDSSKAAPKRMTRAKEAGAPRPSRTKRAAKRVTEQSATPASEAAST